VFLCQLPQVVPLLLDLYIVSCVTSGARKEGVALSTEPSMAGFLSEDGDRIQPRHVISKQI
jgi:hypothetical protein